MCDTFAALPPATDDGSVILGKNSNREPNEAQVLEYHPAASYPESAQVQCTYITIPQVRETHATILSRPFWMWGAEMGVNAKGVAIGNEAVFTRMPLRKTNDSLLGMDLLRLALERAASAQQAMAVIIQLLADHDQGGRCAYWANRTYHNSFLIADPAEAWVLETAGPLWAALKVKDTYSISNGLTIGEEMDDQHPDLISTAQRKGWLKRGQTFHFAQCYSDWFYTTFSRSRQRRACSREHLDRHRGNLDVTTALNILRDHNSDDYYPHRHLFCDRLCAHAAYPLIRHDVQSVGSLAAHLKSVNPTVWVTGTSAPCTGIFKPVWFEGEVLPEPGPAPTGTYDPDSLWWRHERLHRSVLRNFQPLLDTYRHERDELERSFRDRAESASSAARWDVTRQAFAQAREATDSWLERVREQATRDRRGRIYRLYWNKQNRAAGMPL
ncbi:MAG: C69 family dipeptidase [Fidelibacterota bacterium]|nr:MAG: C69 family dipeptidase [Candidatus Neomarinimicrobiota bacterium]